MRLLHTSDWHLGRSFHREGLLAAQQAFVDHLVETVTHERVDLVVVSGDVYDRALPPVDAVALADEALTRLAAAGVPVVLTAGNHDSARRLGFASELIAAAGVHVRSDPAALARPVVVDDAHGPVAVYGLPYLEPEVLTRSWGLDHRSHGAVTAEAMRRVRADLAARPGTRSVVLAHTWVVGGEPSDSERDISVGGVSQVPASVFDGIDYVALGHLHGRQQVSPHLRYSGSPLAYSFSEARQRKGCWLVELGPAGVDRVDFVEAPVPRRLGLLRGRLDDLLTEPRHAAHEQSWVQVTLTDERRPTAAMDRLRRRFPHALVLHFEPEGGPATAHDWTRRLRGRTDVEVVRDFVEVVREHPVDDDEAALLDAACSACRCDAARPGRRSGLGPAPGRTPPDAPAPPRAHGLRAVPRHRDARPRRARRGRAVPAHGEHGSRQDQPARRDLLRAVRARAGRPSGSQASAQRPCGGRRKDAGAARGHAVGAAPARHAHAGVAAAQAARHRHHDAAGVGSAGRAHRRGVDHPQHPHRRDPAPARVPAGHGRHPVHPGSHAAAGSVRGVPARRCRPAPGAAGEALRHRAVPRHRAVAGRAAPTDRPSPRRLRPPSPVAARRHARCRRPPAEPRRRRPGGMDEYGRNRLDRCRRRAVPRRSRRGAHQPAAGGEHDARACRG